MSALDKIIETRRVFDTIEGFYPGLVVLRDKMLYLSDSSISEENLEYVIITDSIRLIGDEFSMSLYGKDKHGNTGTLRMEYDFELSEQSCMDLFKYNLMIYYKEADASKANQFGYVIYDRVSIERNYTIKNIINEQ